MNLLKKLIISNSIIKSCVLKTKKMQYLVFISQIKYLKPLALLLTLLLCFISCNRRKETITKKTITISKEDTLKFINQIPLEWEKNGKHNIFLAVNDSILFHSESSFSHSVDGYVYLDSLIGVNGSYVYVNGNRDFIYPNNDSTKLSILDYKKFMINTNRGPFKNDCPNVELIKKGKSLFSTVKSKKGSVFRYLDVRNKPLYVQICINKQGHKINIPYFNNNSKKTRLGNGDSFIKLFDFDRDGKEELLIIQPSYASIVMSVYKINNLDF